MHELASLIRKIAQRIEETESKRVRLARFVNGLGPVMEIKRNISPSLLDDLKVAAVDGGLVKKSLHGMDCMLVRAAGVCFHYRKGKVSDVKYFPSRNPTPRPEIYESLSEVEWNQFAGLNRLQEEISTAIKCLEAFKPDVLLLDGMILPHYLDRPSRSSPLFPLYDSLMKAYRLLFEKSIKQKTALAGVIEDSRNIVFCDYLCSKVLSRVDHKAIPEIEKLLKKTRDSNLLYLILEKGERTLSFPLQNPQALNFDLPPVKTFYLKTARFDRPLKIDYLPQTILEDPLSSILLAISGQHSGYGLPVPLIEADNVAKLSEMEMESFYSSIISLAGRGASTMKLRREQRPF